ncbi:MAG TPA: HPr family phosphocarrier protein [Stackebrandtia sp.]|jgi:phosphocarrier protein|uniref:HPr family phosphocarrier protein n=1 Tax=Stackebrandtia sp. TaxID=2023065 RepID=UPI002D3722DD|nr:HPr family phosphocarrier protein [Stackebrandtia sp.]HZE37962.1 HPr family phosphocarrier protein [Stackebrandtia sp.]
MATKTVVIGSASGLHARPAKLFVQAATAADAEVRVSTGGKPFVPARSLLAVMALGAKQGAEVTLEADGPHAAEVLESLGALLERDLDAEEADA